MKKTLTLILGLSFYSGAGAGEADPVAKIKLGIRFGEAALAYVTENDSETYPVDSICLLLGRVTAIMIRTANSHPNPPPTFAMKAIQYENFCAYRVDSANLIPRGDIGVMIANLKVDLRLFQDFVDANSPAPLAEARAIAADESPRPNLNGEEQEMLGKLKSVLKLAASVLKQAEDPANTDNGAAPFDSMCMQLGRATAILRRAGKSSLLRRAYEMSDRNYDKQKVDAYFRARATLYEFYCGHETQENKTDLPDSVKRLARGYLTPAATKRLIQSTKDAEAPQKHVQRSLEELRSSLNFDIKSLESVLAPLQQ